MSSASLAGPARHRLMSLVYGSPLYRLKLWGRTPRDIARRAAERWPGDATRGAALLAGTYRFAGETVRSATPPWEAGTAAEHNAIAATSPAWRAELHGFAWLADLAALEDRAAWAAARALVKSWLDQGETWDALSWRADVIGERLTHWLVYFDLLAGDGAQAALRAALLRSIARQVRHLQGRTLRHVRGAARLAALKGLILAQLALDAGERPIERALRRLEREVAAQLLADGGHVERSPAVHVQVLRDLVTIRAALRSAEIEVPGALQQAIDRAAPMLRFFRHGDGGLALFNDTLEGEAARHELVLARSEAKGRAPQSAPHLGFQRLQAGRALVLVDVGSPPPPGLERHTHAGTLSFEMSYGRERLVVNCGAYLGTNPGWRAVARATAAHSTLVVADTNSAELRPDGSLGRRAIAVTCERDEEGGRQWISASHDGYRFPFELTHQRVLFLSADGEDLRGEDRLMGRAGQGFAIRFHLHPDVQASLTQDAAAVLLRLPSGAGWRLRTQGAVLNLAESVYLGTGTARKTQQVVLDGHVGSTGARVQWALRREGK
jgi:uncharacterized heparinase superfamily protein